MKVTNLALGFLLMLSSIGKAETIYQTDISSLQPMVSINSVNTNGYWQSIDIEQQSEVVYKIEFPSQGLWSLTWFNSSISSESPLDYLITYASRTGTDWRKIDQAGIGKVYKNFVRDTSYGSWNNSYMYIRTIFAGESAKIFQSGAYVQVSILPEPCLIVLLIPFLFVRGYRNEI